MKSNEYIERLLDCIDGYIRRQSPWDGLTRELFKQELEKLVRVAKNEQK